jgi:hypothetical protein
MDRRSFTQGALLGLALPSASAQVAFAQLSNVEYEYFELVNAYAQAVLGVTRDTDLAKQGELLADSLIQGLVNASIGQFDLARKSADVFSNVVSKIQDPILVAAQKKGLPEFKDLSLTVSEPFPRTVQLWADSKKPPTALIIPSAQLSCVTTCVLRQATCLGPILLRSAISCAVVARSAISRGPAAFIGAFGGCLLREVPTLTGDAVVECFKPLRDCVAKCLAAKPLGK